MKRYVLQAEQTEIEETFNISHSGKNFEKNYNVMPGTAMPIIIEQENGRKLVEAKWGLADGKSNDIHAIKQEEVLEKQNLKEMAESSPCIIPASGFYKWKETVKDPLPFYLRVLTQEVLPLAGIFSSVKNKKGDLDYTFAVITMDANALVEPLDKTMPCILDENKYESWLRGGALKMLEKGFNGQSLLPNMAVYRVSDLVNDPDNNSKELIQPIPKLRDDD